MDLGAYTNIDNLDAIAKKNNIEVPRLRGYRLMKDESPVNIAEMIDKKQIAISCIECLCERIPFWSIKHESSAINDYTDYLKRHFLIKSKNEDGYMEYTDIRWNRIHGKKRRILKTFIHNEVKVRKKQWEIWNKYAGKENILYIHARISGGNWSYYYDKVVYQPWFLEKVDDSFDSTYL